MLSGIFNFEFALLYFGTFWSLKNYPDTRLIWASGNSQVTTTDEDPFKHCCCCCSCISGARQWRGARQRAQRSQHCVSARDKRRRQRWQSKRSASKLEASSSFVVVFASANAERQERGKREREREEKCVESEATANHEARNHEVARSVSLALSLVCASMVALSGSCCRRRSRRRQVLRPRVLLHCLHSGSLLSLLAWSW